MSKKKVRPFRLAVRASNEHADHMLIEVDSLTGEVTLGPPLSGKELSAITSEKFPAQLDYKALTQMVILLTNEVIHLKKALREHGHTDMSRW